MKTFPMKNVTMIRPKKEQNKKNVRLADQLHFLRWDQLLRVIDWPSFFVFLRRWFHSRNYLNIDLVTSKTSATWHVLLLQKFIDVMYCMQYLAIIASQ